MANLTGIIKEAYQGKNIGQKPKYYFKLEEDKEDEKPVSGWGTMPDYLVPGAKVYCEIKVEKGWRNVVDGTMNLEKKADMDPPVEDDDDFTDGNNLDNLSSIASKQATIQNKAISMTIKNLQANQVEWTFNEAFTTLVNTQCISIKDELKSLSWRK